MTSIRLLIQALFIFSTTLVLSCTHSTPRGNQVVDLFNCQNKDQTSRMTLRHSPGTHFFLLETEKVSKKTDGSINLQSRSLESFSGSVDRLPKGASAFSGQCQRVRINTISPKSENWRECQKALQHLEFATKGRGNKVIQGEKKFEELQKKAENLCPAFDGSIYDILLLFNASSEGICLETGIYPLVFSYPKKKSDRFTRFFGKDVICSYNREYIDKLSL